MKIQMEEKKTRKDQETKKLKELTRTHFGPEGDNFTTDITLKQDELKKNQFNADLTHQMVQNSAHKNKWASIKRREYIQ